MNVSDGEGAPERMNGNWVTSGAFRLIGQRPMLGRDFLPEEDRVGAPSVVILGYGIWQSRYGGDPHILGRTIRVNAVPATIVGVMPQGMQFPYNAELWMPFVPTPVQQRRDVRSLAVFGRLLPAVSMAQARAEMEGVGRQLEQAYPKTNEGIGVRVQSFNERYTADWRTRLMLAILMVAVAFVLLIACVNVANLLLSRAACRAREIAIRKAVGADRWRIVRQLLVESLVLCLPGGALGLLLAAAGARLFGMSLASVENVPYWTDFSIDVRVVVYLAVVCFTTTVVFGLAPALRASKVPVVESLKDEGPGTSGGPRSQRLTASLVVAQLALTVVLLFGAGLMMRDFQKVQALGVGIDAHNMLTMRLALAENRYAGPADRVAFHERLVEHLSAVPGIESVAVTSHLPSSGAFGGRLEIEGREVADKEALPKVNYLVVSRAYFDVLGIRLIGGRGLEANDGAVGSEAVVVNDLFAAKFLRGQEAIGARIRLDASPDSPWATVVGVSPHVWQAYDNRAETDAVVYVPYRQSPVRFVTAVVRSRVSPSELARTLRAQVQALDPDLPLYFVKTMEDHLSQELWPYRVFGGLFVVLGATALLLAVIGLYAVMAYGVSRRTHEIGIRTAVGAGQGDVMWLVLRQGLLHLSLGLGIGLLGSLALGRVVAAMLLETTGTDPLTAVTVSLILSLVALAACVVPARRACRLDPVAALRARG